MASPHRGAVESADEVPRSWSFWRELMRGWLIARGDANPAGDWPRRLAGRAAWRRHCPSGEGARHRVRQWRRFGNGLTAALDFHAACECVRPR
jgi:hypothetical protein